METDRFAKFLQALYSIKTGEPFKDIFDLFLRALLKRHTSAQQEDGSVQRMFVAKCGVMLRPSAPGRRQIEATFKYKL